MVEQLTCEPRVREVWR